MATRIAGEPGLCKKLSLVMTGTMAVVLPIVSAQLNAAQSNVESQSANPPVDLPGLGLKLESQKGQVEGLVIDHVERPSEN
jgi:uncharacterized protein (TIGR03435 family)